MIKFIDSQKFDHILIEEGHGNMRKKAVTS